MTGEAGGSGCHKLRDQVTFLAGVGQPVAWASGRTAFQVENMAGARTLGNKTDGHIGRGLVCVCVCGGSEARVKGGQSRVSGLGRGQRRSRWL